MGTSLLSWIGLKMNGSGYSEKRRTNADRHLPAIREAIAPYFSVEPSRIIVAPEEEDNQHNTDLTVLSVGDGRISCHVRSHRYYRPFSHQVCVRSKYSNGAKTELHKILDGWGDYMFYGFLQPDDSGLFAWTLGDLKVMRGWLLKIKAHTGKIPGYEYTNDDGITCLRAFNLDFLPLEYVVDSHNIPLGWWM